MEVHHQKYTIEYITISTLGDSADFGDLTIARWSGAGGKCIRAIRGGWSIIILAPNTDID